MHISYSLSSLSSVAISSNTLIEEIEDFLKSTQSVYINSNNSSLNFRDYSDEIKDGALYSIQSLWR